jgi:putative oxidoreductase
VLLQRLFSVFPNSWPGRGLLLQRAITASVLLCLGFAQVARGFGFVYALPHVIAASAGIFLLVGLWTPISGAFIALAETWIAFSFVGDWVIPLMLATSGATLAMIGPGAWSIDARLFGRKHFEFSER